MILCYVPYVPYVMYLKIKVESHNLKMTLHMGSNSVWFNLIFDYKRGGQFCPQNIFTPSLFSTLFGVFHALSTVAFSSSPSLL